MITNGSVPGDGGGSLGGRFDCYCKKVIYNAAHNEAYKQMKYLYRQWGEDDFNPDEIEQDGAYDRLLSEKVLVRGREVNLNDEQLVKMLDRLQPRKREILLMSFMLGMTNEEIAVELGISQATVKVTKSNAISELKKGVANRNEEA